MPTRNAATTGYFKLLISTMAVFLACLQIAWGGPETALRDYVSAADPAYGYSHVSTVQRPGFTAHILSMTSQNWRVNSEVNRTLWNHWMVVIVPANILSTTGAILVGGGDNSQLPPSLNSTEVFIGAQLAMASGTVVSIVFNVPNQPLVFADAPSPQGEDALVAYSWDKAMDTADWSWPVYLPMVKAVVRAMDTAQAYVPAVTGLPLQSFIVIGFSKRGAATWLTAVTDARVSAIAPGVFDVLNMAPQLEHHFTAYGFYAPAMQDYVNYDIVRRIRSPEGEALLQVVDPYSYRSTLGLPKFLINSPGDQFFLPDAEKYYLNSLPGETVSRYVPNTDHSLSSSAGVVNALTSLVAWYQHVIFGAPRPQISSSIDAGVLTVRSSLPATVARLWQASNTSARDFRREVLGETWTSTPVPDSGGGTYVASLAQPVTGFSAYYIELVYQGVGGVPQTYSTQIYVTPDVEPYILNDAIVDPHGRGFWKHQIMAALNGKRGAEIDAITLSAYFPIPLFDLIVSDLAAAGAVFASGGKESGARQHCLATRLNIARADLGWYSRLRLEHHSRYLWEHYRESHQAFLNGNVKQAMKICEDINSSGATGVPNH